VVVEKLARETAAAARSAAAAAREVHEKTRKRTASRGPDKGVERSRKPWPGREGAILDDDEFRGDRGHYGGHELEGSDPSLKRPPPERSPSYDADATFKHLTRSKKDKARDAPWASALEPMWGFKHNPKADVVMALGFGYSVREFSRFISTLRAVGYPGDIALAAGPPEKMKSGTEDYLKGEGVLAYQFTYECAKKKGRRLLMTPAGCTLTNWYPGGDKRGPRPLAVSRYEMYRTWLSFYEPTSWGFIFDFRDTFFQLDPFSLVDRSKKAPNLLLFAENRDVKTVGNCIFNSGWLRCWGKDVPKTYKNNSVVCSGSTMGSVQSLKHYTERMVQEMDSQKCHTTPARTESDQGYHNFLYDTGAFAKLPGVRVAHSEQGHGLVNTIGAMNGFRVPKEKKGPLDTFWKIKDAEGYIHDYDGGLSPVVHQWDRFYGECVKHIDRLAQRYNSLKKMHPEKADVWRTNPKVRRAHGAAGAP